MKNINILDIALGSVFVLFFAVALTCIYFSHAREMKMIEAGYVKQPEMWVRP